MRITEINRLEVGKRPTGLLLRDTELTVYEAGDGTISVYDLLTGELLRRIGLPDELNPEMQTGTLGNTLLAGPTDQAFAWTFGNEGLVYHVNHDRVLGRITLGPGALNSWVYSQATQKLVITHYDDPGVYLVRADLSIANLPSFNNTPGMTVLTKDGNSVFVADRNGENVLIIDLATETVSNIVAVGSTLSETYPQGVSLPDSPFIRVFELSDEIGGRGAPMAISPDGRFLYIGPSRADEAEQRTPLAILRLADNALTVISGEGIRFPICVEPNPLYSELYVSGIDETVVVNLTTHAVTHSLGPGRLTGFEVAANGRWAAGVDVFYEEIFVFDLQNKEIQKIPFAGLAKKDDEFDKVPVLIDASSQVTIVADIPANQVVVLRVESA
jgi:DNA-binding beta-propeller fold protein YncE